MIVKIISGFFFLVFLSFAYLQLNDPDPFFWTAIYVVIALVSFIRIVDRQNSKLIVGAILVVGASMLFYLPGFWEWLMLPDKGQIFGEMESEKPYIEETREFIGLTLGLASLLYQYKYQ